MSANPSRLTDASGFGHAFFPSTRQGRPLTGAPLQQNRLREIHRDSRNAFELEYSQTDGGMAQTASMGHEDAQPVLPLNGVHLGKALVEALRDATPRVHQRLGPLYGEPEIGEPAPALRKGRRPGVCGKQFTDPLEAKVRAAPDAAFDQIVPLDHFEDSTRLLFEFGGDQLRRLPGAKKLGGFDATIEFEVESFALMEKFMGASPGLLSTLFTQRQDLMGAGRLLRTIEVTMSNERCNAASP